MRRCPTQANQIRRNLGEIRRDLEKAEVREKERLRWIHGRYRLALRRLRQQLAEERALNAPEESDVLAALAECASPASAKEVAERIYGKRPTHSAIVRIGLSFVRLEAAGRVRRLRVEAHGEERNRWEVVTDA